MKKVYVSEIVDLNSRGKLLGRWKDRVKEYISEKGVRRKRGHVSISRGGGSSAVATPLEGRSRRE